MRAQWKVRQRRRKDARCDGRWKEQELREGQEEAAAGVSSVSGVVMVVVVMVLLPLLVRVVEVWRMKRPRWLEGRTLCGLQRVRPAFV